MKITACPKCGSKHIEMGTMNAGVTFGVTSWKSVCRECGYRGEPLLFDSEEEYKKFLQGIIEEQESDSDAVVEDESSQLSEKDEEVINLLKEEANEVVSQQDEVVDEGVFPKDKSWRIEIGLAMTLSAVEIIFLALDSAGTYGIAVAFLYDVVLFVVSTVIILFVIVIIEYAYFSIKKMGKLKK